MKRQLSLMFLVCFLVVAGANFYCDHIDNKNDNATDYALSYKIKTYDIGAWSMHSLNSQEKMWIDITTDILPENILSASVLIYKDTTPLYITPLSDGGYWYINNNKIRLGKNDYPGCYDSYNYQSINNNRGKVTIFFK